MFEWTAHYLDCERELRGRTLEPGWYLVGQPLAMREASQTAPIVFKITELDQVAEEIAHELAAVFNQRASFQVGV